MTISRRLLDRIVAEVARDPGREVCGLLLGEAEWIAAIRPAPNIAVNPRNSFEIDPHILFEVQRAERDGGARLIGHYHSHPGGRAEPSPRDAEAADDLGRLWLILAGDAASLWRAVDGGSHLGRFAPIALEIND